MQRSGGGELFSRDHCQLPPPADPNRSSLELETPYSARKSVFDKILSSQCKEILMKHAIQKSFAIVTLAVCVFLLGRLYLSLNLEYARPYHAFVDWATLFVSTYLLACGYGLLFVNLAWQRIQLLLDRAKKGEEQPQKSVA
jgi:hypothetical protein